MFMGDLFQYMRSLVLLTATRLHDLRVMSVSSYFPRVGENDSFSWIRNVKSFLLISKKIKSL